ncbi:hypothetical protein BGZ63DRAFT_155862 [Mariannaea sp. PMI_226]|nr:hypothetical protein BGZ63DRAFT_155862 [Mariannaea sp. PMI_226]
MLLAKCLWPGLRVMLNGSGPCPLLCKLAANPILIPASSGRGKGFLLANGYCAGPLFSFIELNLLHLRDTPTHYLRACFSSPESPGSFTCLFSFYFLEAKERSSALKVRKRKAKTSRDCQQDPSFTSFAVRNYLGDPYFGISLFLSFCLSNAP